MTVVSKPAPAILPRSIPMIVPLHPGPGASSPYCVSCWDSSGLPCLVVDEGPSSSAFGMVATRHRVSDYCFALRCHRHSYPHS